MRNRLLAAWYCLRGRPVIYKVSFADTIRIRPPAITIDIIDCHLNSNTDDDGIEIWNYPASNIIPFRK